MNNFDPRLLDAAVKASGGKISRSDLINAAKNGNAKQLLNSLPESDRQKLNKVLSDKTALENLLKNPQVAELMKKLSGGKNG